MNAQPPRIAVAGAGSIGCFVGGLLDAHAPISLIGRPSTQELLDEHGLWLTDLDGGERKLAPGAMNVSTEMQSAQSAHLVLVTVKSGDTEALARQLAPVLEPGVVVLSLQNGVRNVDALRQQLPQQTVLAGMVGFNVVHRGHGWLHRATSGSLMVERSSALQPFLAPFEAAGLALVQRNDMLEVQWAKMLFNLNNAVNGLSDLPLRDELALRPYRCCLALLQDEALRVLDAAGIRPARLSVLPPRWLPRLLRTPDPIFRLLARSLLAIDPLARSSTWEDLAAGRPTEIDYLNGEVVRLAREQNIATPANARLIELVRAAEQGDRRVWHRDALWRELSQAAATSQAETRV